MVQCLFLSNTFKVNPCDRKGQVSVEHRTFFCLGEPFIFGSYWKHQISTPVIALSKTSKWNDRSDTTSNCRSICSPLITHGITFEENVFFLNVSLSKFSSSAISVHQTSLAVISFPHFHTFDEFSTIIIILLWILYAP